MQKWLDVSRVMTCSHPAGVPPLLSCSLVLWFSGDVQPCNVRRSEDQRKRNPCPQQAGKHPHTSENEERDNKEVERDHDTHEEKRRLQWCRVVKPLELAHRQEYKEDGGSYCMDDECRLQRQERSPDAYRCKTQRQPDQGIDNNGQGFLAVHHLLLSTKG